MTTFVETISRCDRPGCQTQETRTGAGGAFPPVGWALVTVSVREDGGDAGKNVGCREDYELCPLCLERIQAILKQPRLGEEGPP